MLTAEQVERYRWDGYLFPLPALSPGELRACNEGLSRFEHWLGSPLTEGDRKWRSAGYVLLPWVDALVRHPRILDAVESVIGPDILRLHQHLFHQGSALPDFCRLAPGRDLFRPRPASARHRLGGADRRDQ